MSEPHPCPNLSAGRSYLFWRESSSSRPGNEAVHHFSIHKFGVNLLPLQPHVVGLHSAPSPIFDESHALAKRCKARIGAHGSHRRRPHPLGAGPPDCVLGSLGGARPLPRDQWTARKERSVGYVEGCIKFADGAHNQDRFVRGRARSFHRSNRRCSRLLDISGGWIVDGRQRSSPEARQRRGPMGLGLAVEQTEGGAYSTGKRIKLDE